MTDATKGDSVAVDLTGAAGPVSVDLEQKYPDQAWDERLKSAVKDHTVFMISKSTCPFCLEAKKVFADLGVQVHAVESDLSAHGDVIRKECTNLTNLKTVPSIWVNGKHVGGCNDLKTLQTKGELNRLLGNVKTTQDASKNPGVGVGRKTAPKPLLWFPETVNNHVIRLVGLFTVIIGVVSLIFWDETWAHWMIAGLMADFAVRFTYGGSFSPLGSLASLLVANVRPKFSPGPPKQFAAFVGLMFTIIAVICDFADVPEAGAAVIAALVVAAGLEAFLNFCLGCWFFGLMIKIGLVSPNVYTLHLNTRDDSIYLWEEQFVQVPTPAVEKVGYGDDATEISLRYKVKTDAHERQDFHPIKHHHARFFMWPMSVGGLAMAWRVAALNVALKSSETVWKTIGYIGGVTFGILLVMYIIKAVLYPKKVKKEWMHPVMGNSFGAISLCFIIYSSLVMEELSFAKVLFWIGAPAHLLLTVVRTAELIGRRVSQEHVNVGWMIFPVGNFVAAMVAPDLDSDYFEPAFLWYGPAIIMWLVLFPVTFHQAVTSHNSDTRQRGLLFIWVAAPAAAALAYLRLTGSLDIVTKSLLWFTAIIFVTLLWATLPYLFFFTCEPFHMSYWVYAFCIDTVAIALVTYDTAIQTGLTYVMSVGSLSIATWVVMVAFFHTLTGIVRRHIFRPEVKWGPLSFMKLTHEAIRPALEEIEKLVQDVVDTGVGSPSFHVLVENLKVLQVVHEEHSKHEDDIVFKAFEEIFPGKAAKFCADHSEDHSVIPEIIGALQNLNSDSSADAIKSACSRITDFAEHLRKHLQGEEDHLNPIGRKYLNIDTHKMIVRNVWNATPVERWRVILPWVVNHLPIERQRGRFLKTFMWALPERVQQIGRYVYEGVDAVQWRALTRNVPDIIPRDADGWYRYY